ncbi:hypothetical protein KI387_044594, partial [Taxus chinensis]
GCDITTQLIEKYTGLINTGNSFDDDLANDVEVKKVTIEFEYKKSGCAFNIVKLDDPVMKMAAHFLTKLSGQERWKH